MSTSYTARSRRGLSIDYRCGTTTPTAALRPWADGLASAVGVPWATRVMAPELAVFCTTPEVVEQAVLEITYAGHVSRQAHQVARFRRLEGEATPPTFEYAAVPQLRADAKEKLGRVRPASPGESSRISGIAPADISVLMTYLH